MNTKAPQEARKRTVRPYVAATVPRLFRHAIDDNDESAIEYAAFQLRPRPVSRTSMASGRVVFTFQKHWLAEVSMHRPCWKEVEGRLQMV